MELDRAKLKANLARAAGQGVWLGASSWKYPGWRGLLYDDDRYIWRGKFSESRFEKNCLAEYAEVFKTVCVDAAYYSFPTARQLAGLASQVPADFLFALKVTDEITRRAFPNLPRFGARAGKANPNFLDPDLFERQFLDPCKAIRQKIGLILLEFSKFHPGDYTHGRDFVADLDRFLGALPQGWPFGVEIRNRNWLKPEYFGCLRKHGVTHVFNSWSEMPAVSEQMGLEESFTHPTLTAARFLLKPGRTYEEAVKNFQPYNRTKEVNAEARRAGAELILKGAENPARKTFVYVNNRLEGNSLKTMDAMLEAAWGGGEL